MAYCLRMIARQSNNQLAWRKVVFSSPATVEQTTEQNSATPQTPKWLRDIGSFLNSFTDESPTITLHSSGSTGAPRPIVIIKRTLRSSAQLTINHFQLTAQSRLAVTLPCTFIAGKMMLVRGIESQATLHLLRPDGAALCRLPRHVAYDLVAAVPMQISRLRQQFGDDKGQRNARCD